MYIISSLFILPISSITNLCPVHWWNQVLNSLLTFTFVIHLWEVDLSQNCYQSSCPGWQMKFTWVIPSLKVLKYLNTTDDHFRHGQYKPASLWLSQRRNHLLRIEAYNCHPNRLSLLRRDQWPCWGWHLWLIFVLPISSINNECLVKRWNQALSSLLTFTSLRVHLSRNWS